MKYKQILLLTCLGLFSLRLIFPLSLWAQEPKLLATLKGHTHWVFSVAISPDGKTVASGSRDTTIRLWDVASGREKAELNGNTGAVHCVAFSPDGMTLASAAGGVLARGKMEWLIAPGEIKLWDVATGKEIASLKGHVRLVISLAFSPDGKTLASGSEDNRIKLWNVAERKEKLTLKGHPQDFGDSGPSMVNAVVFSPDGKTLASGGTHGSIKMWDVVSGNEKSSLMGVDGVRTLAFSPDGKAIASGDYHGRIKFWDLASVVKKRIEVKGHNNSVTSIAFSPDGKTLASGGGGEDSIKLWHVSSGKEKAILSGQPMVTSVTFSRDGKTLVSGSMDNTVKLWDVVSVKD